MFHAPRCVYNPLLVIISDESKTLHASRAASRATSSHQPGFPGYILKYRYFSNKNCLKLRTNSPNEVEAANEWHGTNVIVYIHTSQGEARGGPENPIFGRKYSPKPTFTGTKAPNIPSMKWKLQINGMEHK